MASKKTPSKAPAHEQLRSDTPLITVRIDRILDNTNTKIKAFASANIAGAFAIHGIRVIDSQKGLFVQMPQESYQKNGRTEYSDIFHPITADARSELYGTVLAAYEQCLQMRESEQQHEQDEDQDQDQDEEPDEDVGFEQSM